MSVICINFGNAQVFDSHRMSVRTRVYSRVLACTYARTRKSVNTHTHVAYESLASGHAWTDKLLLYSVQTSTNMLIAPPIDPRKSTCCARLFSVGEEPRFGHGIKTISGPGTNYIPWQHCTYCYA